MGGAYYWIRKTVYDWLRIHGFNKILANGHHQNWLSCDVYCVLSRNQAKLLDGVLVLRTSYSFRQLRCRGIHVIQWCAHTRALT